MTQEPCTVCRSKAKRQLVTNGSAGYLTAWDCPRCGYFILEGQAAMFPDVVFISDVIRGYASAYIQRMAQPHKCVTVQLPDSSALPDWHRALRGIGLPTTVPEQMDAMVVATADKIVTDGLYPEAPVKFVNDYFITKLAAPTSDYVHHVASLLHKTQLLQLEPDDEISITPAGWLRAAHLKDAKLAAGKTGFIACWFGSPTVGFRESAAAAITMAGYDPVIISESHFNGYIMDAVLSAIRSSAFVIADYTTVTESEDQGVVSGGSRGGVYFEAGFALGLGKPVIQTCKEDNPSKSRIHFDTKQINTIFWSDGDCALPAGQSEIVAPIPSLTDRLHARITATAGRGPLAK